MGWEEGTKIAIHMCDSRVMLGESKNGDGQDEKGKLYNTS